MKKPSLADKINNLINVAPTSFESDDEAEETQAKIVEKLDETDFEDEIELKSSIRKQNLSLLEESDARYKGKKVSRRDIYGSISSVDDDDDNDDDDDDEDDDDDDDDDDKKEKTDEENEESDVSESDQELSKVDDSFENEVDDANPLYKKRDFKEAFKNISSTDLKDEAEKGNCVKQQLKLWENLLEIRIQLQKCLVNSNKLPQFDTYKDLSKKNEFVNSKTTVVNNLKGVLDNLLNIQDRLFKNYPETTDLFFEKKAKLKVEEDLMDEKICSDTEEEEEEEEESDQNDNDNENENENEPVKKKQKLDYYDKILDDRHKKYLAYCNLVIQKWNDKTRISSGNTNKITSQPIVKQIEFILNDKSKIIRKSQLKRSEYEIIGKKSSDNIDNDGRRVQEYDEEIYDDDDFYHQLLRELIEKKTSSITDPIQLSKQWIQLQNMRSKMKRKIDTRATKGRRIRYNVHNKLVNFMAPITINDNWSDSTKTELYNSLFGKIRSNNTEVTV